jgi:hypothetical protein
MPGMGDIMVASPFRDGFHAGRKAAASTSGGHFIMKKREIIFFDELGFGWIVDKAIIQTIHDNTADKEVIVEKTLADLLRRP